MFSRRLVLFAVEFGCRTLGSFLQLFNDSRRVRTTVELNLGCWEFGTGDLELGVVSAWVLGVREHGKPIRLWMLSPSN
jgi:hypothetical protein